jgi:hypothetical protein
MKYNKLKQIVLRDQDIQTTDCLSQFKSGKFRMIIKTRLMRYPQAIISGYEKGVLQTVEFCPDGSDFYLTVFSRTGKKVKLIDETILANLTVGVINSMYTNTNLYSQDQYKMVNSTSWASKAFVMNKELKTELA